MKSSAPSAKNRAPLMALYAANAISMAGNLLTAIAIPWFVLQSTGSAAQTGITGFFSILPVIIAGSHSHRDVRHQYRGRAAQPDH